MLLNLDHMLSPLDQAGACRRANAPGIETDAANAAPFRRMAANDAPAYANSALAQLKALGPRLTAAQRTSVEMLAASSGLGNATDRNRKFSMAAVAPSSSRHVRPLELIQTSRERS